MSVYGFGNSGVLVGKKKWKEKGSLGLMGCLQGYGALQFTPSREKGVASDTDFFKLKAIALL
jgi:hypothetical protein